MNLDEAAVGHQKNNSARSLRTGLSDSAGIDQPNSNDLGHRSNSSKSKALLQIKLSDIPEYPFRSFSTPSPNIETQGLRSGPSTSSTPSAAGHPKSYFGTLSEYDNYFGRSLPDRLHVDVEKQKNFGQSYPEESTVSSAVHAQSEPMLKSRFLQQAEPDQVAYSSVIHEYLDYSGGESDDQREQSRIATVNLRVQKREIPFRIDDQRTLHRYGSANNLTVHLKGHSKPDSRSDQHNSYKSHSKPASYPHAPVDSGTGFTTSNRSVPQIENQILGSFNSLPRPSRIQNKDNVETARFEGSSTPRTLTPPQQSIPPSIHPSTVGSSSVSAKRSPFGVLPKKSIRRSRSLPEISSNNPLSEAATAAEAIHTAPSNSLHSDSTTSQSSSSSSGTDRITSNPMSSRAISYNYPLIQTDPSTSTRLGLLIPSPRTAAPIQFSLQTQQRSHQNAESSSSRSQPPRAFDLKSIVSCPPMLRFFRILVSATTAEENLEYLLALKLLAASHASVEDYLAPEMLSDLLCDALLDIQAKFLLDGSPMELNLPDGVRRSVNEAVMWRVWDAGRDGGRRLLCLRDVIDSLAPVTKEISILMQPLVRAFNTSIDRGLQSEKIQNMPYKRHVIVVGGGFAGITCAMTLDTVPDFHCTLIDTKEFFEFTPAFAKTLVNPSIDTIRLHHTDILQNGRFMLGSCDVIGPNSIRVNSRVLGFHYLVIATGSSYGNEIKSRGASHAFRIKQLAQEYAELKDASSVLVAGGGLVGVEIAAEIAAHFPDRARKSITLVESGAALLRRNHSKAHSIALRKLNDMGVNVIFNTRVSTVTAMSSGGAVLLSEGVGGNVRTKHNVLTSNSSNSSLRSEFDRFESRSTGLLEDADPDLESILARQSTDPDWLDLILRQPNEYDPARVSPSFFANRLLPRPPSSTADPTRYSNSRANRTRYLVLTDSNHRILVDKVYVATGPRPNSPAMAESMARCVDAEGYIRVEGSMQVVGFRNIFAVGDVVDVDEEKTFWRSCMEGINTAKNIQRVEAGKKPVMQGTRGYPKPNSNPVIQLISLGNKEAIAIFNRSVVRSGPFFLKMKNKAEEDFMTRLKNHLPFPFIFGRIKTG
ncbi:hypothetical protein BJ742DRAFT_785028 [Cladochytrium replicatum]|nr:hypothetical protein BJ742DRAFT_785028 [Cladochytrium replicatum]